MQDVPAKEVQQAGPPRPQAAPQPWLAQDEPPELVMLLAEPDVQLLMRVDGVDEEELRAMLSQVSVDLRRNRNAGGIDTGPQNDDAQYRPGVGIILLNARYEAFVGRRIDLPEDAWQMPQGGIQDGETPQEAALRELKEETGIDTVEVLAESKPWLYYDVPDEFALKAWGGRWKGQRQKWFVMLFGGCDAEITIETENPEFSAWAWVPVRELIDLAASFKRQLYTDIIGEFAALFRD